MTFAFTQAQIDWLRPIIDDPRRKLDLWRYDYRHVRPHTALGNKTRDGARRALALSEGSATAALAQAQNDNYQPQGFSF